MPSKHDFTCIYMLMALSKCIDFRHDYYHDSYWINGYCLGQHLIWMLYFSSNVSCFTFMSIVCIDNDQASKEDWSCFVRVDIASNSHTKLLKGGLIHKIYI